MLDLGLPGMGGLTAVGRFRQANRALAVVVLTMSDEPATVAAALRAGAQGYLVKGSEPDDIERALVAAARGQAVFGSQVAATVLQQASSSRPPARYPQLSDREHDVLDLLLAGRTNQQIAEALFIAPKTARNLVSSILTKLGRTRAELIASARDG